MSSRSASPSISQFFKSQRKRPRTGKEDGVVTASKKLLLEEGIIKSKEYGDDEIEKSAEVESNNEQCQPAAVMMDKTSNSEKAKQRTVKKVKKTTTGKKTTSTCGESNSANGEAKISMFVKPVKDTVSTTSVDNKIENDSENGDSLKSSTDPSSSEKNSLQAQTEVLDRRMLAPRETTPPPLDAPEEITLVITPAPVTAVPALKEDNVAASSKSVGSPVKFLKLGALSPAKRKKMTTEQIARLLKKKNKLSDLKNALEGINQGAQKLTDFRRTVAEANAKASPVQSSQVANTVADGRSSATKSTKGMSPAQFYSPSADRGLKDDLDRLSATKLLASPSKLVNMNNKVKKRLFEEQASPKEDKKIPAYQRFHNLAQKTGPETGAKSAEEVDLPLPYHFKVLKELFIGVETVLGIMKGRKETIIFPKVKSGVLELVRKLPLSEKHLAQIVTILPGCYKFSLEKVRHETHIKIDVEDLLPTVICSRRKAFHSALINICLKHHEKFLLGLVPPIVVPADKQITRWHPNFKIDEIPQVIPCENALPAKPAPEKISTARDVIAKAQSIFENANPRMKQAMKNMVNNAESDGGQKPQEVVTEPKPKATLQSIKGVSQSLLEKIRNREKEKLLKEMTRSPAESKKLQMMRRLPNFIKIVRNMMVGEKKIALPMDTVIDRASHSIQGLSAGDADAHVRLMATLLPQWIKIHRISHSESEYVRINKDVDINDLLHELDDIIKKSSS